MSTVDASASVGVRNSRHALRDAPTRLSYHSAMSSEIASTSAPDLGIIRAGFLEKQKGYRWSERYFVLTKTELHRFERRRKKDGQAEDLFGTPKHSMRVRDITTFEPMQSDRRLVEIKSRAGSSGKQYAMTLRAKSPADASAWLESIGYAKRAARRQPLKRKNTISGDYQPSPGGPDAGSMDEASIETPGAHGSPAGWDTKGSPAKRTAAPGSGVADRVTLISQRVGDVESVLALFPSPTAPTSLTGVAKQADVVVTLASGARYKVAASKCQKANSKVALERFEGPGFASMCATPPEVWIHFHGSPRRNKRGAPATPRPAPSAGGGAKTRTGSGCNHFKWALLGAVPMTLWFCAASEAQTRYICAALLSLTFLVQFILSRFMCRKAVQAGGAVDAAAAAAAADGERKFYDYEAICEIVGADGGASPGAGSDPSTPGTPRSPSLFVPAAPAMALDQLTELPLMDPRARIEALLRNGGLEEFTDETGGDMGTEESSPFTEDEMAVAQRVCEAIFVDYQATYDNLRTRDYGRNSVATPPVKWADGASGTYHPAALLLDSTLLVGFVRGYTLTVSKKDTTVKVDESYVQVVEALVKSLSWRVDLRTATTLEEELPFVSEVRVSVSHRRRARLPLLSCGALVRWTRRLLAPSLLPRTPQRSTHLSPPAHTVRAAFPRADVCDVAEPHVRLRRLRPHDHGGANRQREDGRNPGALQGRRPRCEDRDLLRHLARARPNPRSYRAKETRDFDRQRVPDAQDALDR